MVAGEDQVYLGAAVKLASAATLTTLSTSQYLIIELYDITLVTGQAYHFTNFQQPIVSGIFNYSSPNTYGVGLTITRDTITQRAGVEAGNVKVTLSPQADSPAAPVLIAGYPIQQAAAYGFLDGATVAVSKLFLNFPDTPAVLQPVLAGGAVGWFKGTVQEVETDRLSVILTVDDYLAFLGNQQMPRLLYQAGCWHEVYDAGCTLLAASFTDGGAITGAGDGAHFTTNLSRVDNYYNLGVLTFLTGANTGQSANVALFKSAGAAFTMRFPFPVTPSPGDTFHVYPGCDKTLGQCKNTSTSVGPAFNNLAHFGGMPFIPTPETILDGATDNPPLQVQGGQAGQIIGSQPTGRGTYTRYKS